MHNRGDFDEKCQVQVCEKKKGWCSTHIKFSHKPSLPTTYLIIGRRTLDTVSLGDATRTSCFTITTSTSLPLDLVHSGAAKKPLDKLLRHLVELHERHVGAVPDEQNERLVPV